MDSTGDYGGQLPSKILPWVRVLSTLQDSALGLLQLLFPVYCCILPSWDWRELWV